MLLLLSLAFAAEPQPAVDAAGDALPTAAFREEHVRLEAELDDVTARVGRLATLDPDAQRKEMAALVRFFRQEVGAHAQWEERALYPAVDRRAATPGPEPFTASMRHDHTVVERWIDELDGMTDAVAYTRRADNLLGLVRAHFEAEEDVLLPILDRTMTAEEFREEIPMHGRR